MAAATVSNGRACVGWLGLAGLGLGVAWARGGGGNSNDGRG